jgi:hypothetical protein
MAQNRHRVALAYPLQILTDVGDWSLQRRTTNHGSPGRLRNSEQAFSCLEPQFPNLPLKWNLFILRWQRGDSR